MRRNKGTLAGVVAIALIALPWTSTADRALRARLSSLNEVPTILSEAGGRFSAKVDRDAQTVEYTLEYEGLSADALFAHIHIGQRFANGGVIVFLCNNDPTIPLPSPACPLRGGLVTGTLTPASVIGPAGQGITPGDFQGLLDALVRGRSYVNVHSAAFPGGEIRGQIR